MLDAPLRLEVVGGCVNSLSFGVALLLEYDFLKSFLQVQKIRSRSQRFYTVKTQLFKMRQKNFKILLQIR